MKATDTLYENAVANLDNAAFDMLRLSSAYGGEIGRLLFNAAGDVGDIVRKLRRQLAECVSPNQPGERQ